MTSAHESVSADDLSAELGAVLTDRGLTIAVAESLTGGLLVQALAKVQGSGAWIVGGVTAYATSAKRHLLGVTADKVVSRECAEQMATGARRQLHTSLAVAVTGVAGPDPQDDEPPGTVWIGVDNGSSSSATLHRLSGEPPDICEQTVRHALQSVLATLGPA
jgi:nicotinamide-nucleotide amidase